MRAVPPGPERRLRGVEEEERAVQTVPALPVLKVESDRGGHGIGQDHEADHCVQPDEERVRRWGQNYLHNV